MVCAVNRPINWNLNWGVFMENNNLQVGFGRASIMPEGVVHLAGGDAAKRRSTYAKDELFVTCVALREKEQTILVYTMDLITADSANAEDAKAAIIQATGVPDENILLNATHTHASVSIRTNWEGVKEYRELFCAAMAQAGVDAIADLAPATVYYGDTMTERMTFVRHYKLSDGSYAGANFGNFKNGEVIGHSSEADGQLQIVKFAREGKKDVVMTAFGAHGTFASTADTYISADFPSPTREYIENNSDCLVAHFIAAAGDQVPSSRIKTEERFGREEYREYGAALGQYVLDAMPHLKKLENTALKLMTKTVTYPANKEKLHLLPYVDEVVAKARELGNIHKETVALAREKGFSSYFEATAIRARSNAPDTRDMNLRTMTLGQLGFIFAPYEMFGTQGVYVKEHSPCDMTFIVTCSEGAKGYMPSRLGIEIGCYESCVTQFAPGTAENLAKDFVAMLAEMQQ